MREEVEVLEEHAGAQPNLADLLLVLPAARDWSGSASRRTPSTSTEPTVGSSRKLMQRSSVVLPRAGAADDHHGLALAHLEVDAPKHVVRAEVLLEPPTRTIGSPTWVGSGEPRRSRWWPTPAAGRDRRAADPGAASRSPVASCQAALEAVLEEAEDDREDPVARAPRSGARASVWNAERPTCWARHRSSRGP